jgi:Spx/MgsR family transcriptional regulator
VLLFLKKQRVAFVEKEITKTPPSIAELQQMLQYKKGRLKALFNTSGQLYRDLKLNEKLDKMPLEEALNLLSQNGMLVKRPFLIGDNFGLTGFNEAEWSKCFADYLD